MDAEIETCDECGFDASRWNDRDTINTLSSLGIRWRYGIEGMPEALLHRRPDDATWSIAEYTDHVREVLWLMRFVIDTARMSPGAHLPSAPDRPFDGEPRVVDLDAALAAVDEECAAITRLARDLTADQWRSATVIVDPPEGSSADAKGGANGGDAGPAGDERATGWWLRHAVHDVSHHLHDVGRIRARLGAGATPEVGRVEQISTSSGGVPKTARESATVTWTGIEGDTQAARQHHGRPWQALCLWSEEVIDALRAEGHPITAGAAGENLTLRGLDWSTLHPGTILRIGSVVCELSAWSQPCTKNSRWFADGDHRRIEHELHPGWSRVYAAVLRPGRIEVGDDVEVEPPDAA